MKKIVILLFSIISLFAVQIINNPTDTLKLNIAKKSVNRLVLPSKILDIAYSKEKGINIKIVGNQAFLKCIPIKKQKFEKLAGNANPNSIKPIGKPQLVYKSAPTEVYFITENGTYSFIFYPKNISPQTIIINDFKTSAKKIIKYETEDNYIKTLSKINKSVLNNLSPFGYKVYKINKVVYHDKSFITTLKNQYKGVLYNVYLYEVNNLTNKPTKLSVKALYGLVHNTPKAITIFYDNQVNYLLPFSKAKVVIVEGRNVR